MRCSLHPICTQSAPNLHPSARARGYSRPLQGPRRACTCCPRSGSTCASPAEPKARPREKIAAAGTASSFLSFRPRVSTGMVTSEVHRGERHRERHGGSECGNLIEGGTASVSRRLRKFLWAPGCQSRGLHILHEDALGARPASAQFVLAAISIRRHDLVIQGYSRSIRPASPRRRGSCQ